MANDVPLIIGDNIPDGDTASWLCRSAPPLTLGADGATARSLPARRPKSGTPNNPVTRAIIARTQSIADQLRRPRWADIFPGHCSPATASPDPNQPAREHHVGQHQCRRFLRGNFCNTSANTCAACATGAHGRPNFGIASPTGSGNDRTTRSLHEEAVGASLRHAKYISPAAPLRPRQTDRVTDIGHSFIAVFQRRQRRWPSIRSRSNALGNVPSAQHYI